jgi:hypothetical protein
MFFKGYKMIRKEFIHKSKEKDGHVLARVDNRSDSVWGVLTLAEGKDGVTMFFSGYDVKEIDESVRDLDQLASIISEFVKKYKEQAALVRKNLKSSE